MRVCVCLYVEQVLKSKSYIWSWIKTGSVGCLYTPVLPSLPEMEGIRWGASFLIFLYFLGVTLFLLACRAGLPSAIQVCCCVPCLLSAITSLCLFSNWLVYYLSKQNSHQSHRIKSRSRFNDSSQVCWYAPLWYAPKGGPPFGGTSTSEGWCVLTEMQW